MMLEGIYHIDTRCPRLHDHHWVVCGPGFSFIATCHKTREIKSNGLVEMNEYNLNFLAAIIILGSVFVGSLIFIVVDSSQPQEKIENISPKCQGHTLEEIAECELMHKKLDKILELLEDES